MILLSQYKLAKSVLPSIKSSLEKFVSQMEILYGDKALKINIHQLLHLIDDINAWGLLWTHNSFIYESMNGFFIKMIHGTKSLPKAAIYALNCIQKSNIKEMNIQFKETEVMAFYNRLQQITTR
jgi:hypothetical protein